MARRRIAEDPTSRLAIWARRLALFALAVALLAVAMVQAGFIEPVPGVVTLGAALVIAALGILLAFAAFVTIWNEGLQGLRQAILAFLIGIGLIAYPAFLGVRGYGLPALNDITTDTADPPRFEAVARLRPREANASAYPGASAAELQRRAYPDVEPLQLSSPPQDVYEAALDVVTKRKWLVIDARTPQGGRRDGRIEAVARTPVMGFRDDVVVRVRASAGGTRVDIRSASRYGKYDFGANARRVRSLAEDIEEAAGTQPAARR
jgi:uncharacterized protein (DUF1499 family)